MQAKESSKEEGPRVDVGRAVDFPSLDEASIQKDNPELFTYISNLEDIIKGLTISNPLSISSPPSCSP